MTNEDAVLVCNARSLVWSGMVVDHTMRGVSLNLAHRSTPTSETSEATQKEHGAALEQQVASASSNASDLQAEISRLQKEVEESKGTVESLERTGNWIWSGEDRTCCCQGSFQILSRCFMRSCSLLLVAACDEEGLSGIDVCHGTSIIGAHKKPSTSGRGKQRRKALLLSKRNLKGFGESKKHSRSDCVAAVIWFFGCGGFLAPSNERVFLSFESPFPWDRC